MVYELKTKDYDETIGRAKGYALVDFKAKWCTPCKLQKPVLELLSVKHEGRIAFFTCDIDEEIQLVNRFSIFSVPTMLLFKDGQVVSKIIGYKSVAVLEDIIMKQIQRDNIPAMA